MIETCFAQTKTSTLARELILRIVRWRTMLRLFVQKTNWLILSSWNVHCKTSSLSGSFSLTLITKYHKKGALRRRILPEIPTWTSSLFSRNVRRLGRRAACGISEYMLLINGTRRVSGSCLWSWMKKHVHSVKVMMIPKSKTCSLSITNVLKRQNGEDTSP